MTDLVLDSNALTGWADRHSGLLALLEAAQRAGGVIYVPTVCLVESLTGGGRDARLNQVSKGTRLVGLDERLARTAAALRAAVSGDDVTDPVVVATAATTGATVVSSDDDIVQLAAFTRPATFVVDPRGS